MGKSSADSMPLQCQLHAVKMDVNTDAFSNELRSDESDHADQTIETVSDQAGRPLTKSRFTLGMQVTHYIRLPELIFFACECKFMHHTEIVQGFACMSEDQMLQLGIQHEPNWVYTKAFRNCIAINFLK